MEIGYTNHDAAVRDLFEHKSLEALAYLVEEGRELEFTWNGTMCFLSRSGSRQYVSLWYNSTQQSFDSIPQLMENATLAGVPFRTAWKHAELRYLF